MASYKIVKELYQGAFSQVWLIKTESKKEQKQYVLKQLFLRNATRRERQAAHDEVKLLSTLNHSNIVQYINSFYNSDGSLYIIMVYCERGDMFNYIQRRNNRYFENRQIIRWFLQLSLALKYLHDKNILHRDLKTKNLYLSRSKLIKIGDLGIARMLKNKNDMARTMIGTPAYMSPEIFCSKPYSHKSDVWSLGCCLYEIITLQQAFIAIDMQDLLDKVIKTKIKEIPNGICDEGLIKIVLSMLSYNPEDRPNMSEVLFNPFTQNSIQVFLTEIKPTLPVLVKSANQKKHSNSKSMSKKTDDCHCPNISSTVTLRVPDINGNGDCNNNSQEHSLKPHDNKLSIPRLAVSKSAPTKNVFQICNNTYTKSAKNSVRNETKHQGERSVEFLINLTYTLKQARSQSLTPNEVTHLPIVKEHLSAKCSENARSKLMSPSVKSDSVLINHVSPLTNIKNNINTSGVKTRFPIRGNSADGELSKCVTSDTNINDGILAEILGCKKVTNVAARQRRRQKLKENKTSNTTASSTNMLPALTQNKS